MGRADLANTSCPVSRVIERVGDPWVLMILREAFLGTRRFDDFQVQTGVSPHLLSQRLKQLCEDEILQRRAYNAHPPRYEYLLTDKGRDLWPVIIALRNWGQTWLGGETITLTHKACGARIDPVMTCPDCGTPLGARDVQADLSPEFKQERKTRREGKG
ncbi:winged helix-turn-helix transcriptional regulator [Antarcticimicrobium sediminis]|uniref:Transcriptional regulator n=1 Tax=Antarcticimicrobium sediminis TaxID=2546227 RepID=A0A4V2Z6Z0_9RHOB|nr:helix-turn-helix domain-containing protein [Antarcticimicrobium sediminis]TDE34546.1 transcriptional regulator [Antarcticimicrobium sediminis]